MCTSSLYFAEFSLTHHYSSINLNLSFKQCWENIFTILRCNSKPILFRQFSANRSFSNKILHVLQLSCSSGSRFTLNITFPTIQHHVNIVSYSFEIMLPSVDLLITIDQSRFNLHDNMLIPVDPEWEFQSWYFIPMHLLWEIHHEDRIAFLK